MAYLLFLDESGHDLKDSPYEVLAGVAVEDRDLWNLICAVQQSEETHFGQRYADVEREMKAKRLLKRKVSGTRSRPRRLQRRSVESSHGCVSSMERPRRGSS